MNVKSLCLFPQARAWGKIGQSRFDWWRDRDYTPQGQELRFLTIRTHAESPVGANGRSPLQVVYDLVFCVSPDNEKDS